MKNIRFIFLLSMGITALGLVFAGYQVLFGPNKIETAGKSIGELVKEGDILGILAIPIVIIIMVFSLRPFWKLIFPPQIKNGVEASAEVLQVWDTGVSINDNPQVGLLLEVHPPGGASFQVKAKTLVSRLSAGLVQAGVGATVIYDPLKPQHVEVKSIETGEAADASGGRTAARLRELDRIREEGLITADEYKSKREDILRDL